MIRSIAIDHFRGIKRGELRDFTPLVVFVGPNGCGKSLLLEALYVASHPVPGDALAEIVRSRQGINFSAPWLFWKTDPYQKATIEISTDKRPSVKTELTVDASVQKHNPYTVRLVPCVNGAGSAHDSIVFPIDRAAEHHHIAREIEDVPHVRYVESSDKPSQEDLFRLHSLAYKLGRRQQIVELLKPMCAGLENIELLTEYDDRPSVHLSYLDGSVPAAMSGDGIHSALRFAYETATADAGALLLEEPENTLYPSTLFHATGMILDAVQRGVQVFVTTHNMEFLDVLLARMGMGSPNDDSVLSLYVLRRKDGELISSRLEGKSVRFSRVEIGNDLR